MQASEIIVKASALLHDFTKVRWSEEQLLGYINDGQREIVMMRPDASVVTEAVTLTAGDTKQSIPEAGIRLVDVIRNMGSGSTAGIPVMIIDRDILDTQVPTWHSSDAEPAVKHYVFDPKNPKSFYVFPRPSAGVAIELVYSIPPAIIPGKGDPITISEIYANALLDYVMFRAFSKDTEYADQQKAVRYYELFGNSLGVKFQVDMSSDPNLVEKADGRA